MSRDSAKLPNSASSVTARSSSAELVAQALRTVVQQSMEGSAQSPA